MNIEQVLNECGVEKHKPADVLEAIQKLSESYNKDELAQIYNYILSNIKDIEILSGVIKLADAIKDKSTLPFLIDILLLRNNAENSDEIINLRVLCIKAIAKYKDPSTMDTLLYCLNNKNENYKIRLTCADALGRIGNRYAVTPLVNVLKDDEEKSVYVKESATFALGLIGDTSAIDPLVEIMEAKQGLWGNFSFLKEKIVEVLGKLNINNANVYKVLKNSLMDSSPMVRINAIEALMNSDYEEAPELIKQALHDEDTEVQKNALIALYNLIGRDILDEVISLPSYSENLKEEAKGIIAEYEDE